jgi:phage terminase small subunit
MSKEKPLNDKQRLFVLGVFEGKNATQAYLDAGYKVKESVAAANASRMLKNANISAYLEELRTSREEKTKLNFDRKRERLAQIAETGADPDALRAIQIDNLMMGHNKPTEFKGEVTLKAIMDEIAPARGLPGKRKELE